MLQDPTHDSIYGRNYATMMLEKSARSFDMSRDWCTVLYKPAFGDDLNFDGGFNNWTANSGSAADDTFFMGALWEFPAANTPGMIEYEFFTVFEINGRQILGKTPSEVDPAGFGAITAASAQPGAMSPYKGSTAQGEFTFLKHIEEYAGKGLSFVTKASDVISKFSEIGEVLGII
jgi:hypothetical protein